MDPTKFCVNVLTNAIETMDADERHAYVRELYNYKKDEEVKISRLEYELNQHKQLAAQIHKEWLRALEFGKNR